MLGLQNEREWRTFCARVLNAPALASDERFSSNARRVAAKEILKDVVEDAFSTLSAEQVIARLEEARIANAHVDFH